MLFVFEVIVKPGYSAEQYADAWVEASRILQQATGAMGTHLHRDLHRDDRLLAIARWRSKAHRDAMEVERPQRAQEIIATQARFVEVNVLGEFEDPDWTVEPRRT